jgi:hypothetical protein
MISVVGPKEERKRKENGSVPFQISRCQKHSLTSMRSKKKMVSVSEIRKEQLAIAGDRTLLVDNHIDFLMQKIC